jgi:signal transduction histidine kinase
MVREVTAAEQRRIADELAAVHRSELEVVAQSVARACAALERTFAATADLAAGEAADQIRDRVRGDSRLRQIFVLDERGAFQHPPENPERRTAKEAEFFERISPVWQPGEAMFLHSRGESDGSELAATGWFSWFWGDGVRHVFWKRQPSGRIVGVEADRAALLAAVIADLPEPASGLTGLRVLSDARGQVIYQWGDPKTAVEGLKPSAEISLADPLGMWRLRSYGASASAGAVGVLGKRASSGLIAAISLAVLLVLLLSWYFYREHNRQVREAEQRVSFVNQVSHELKTPLTNIRMYAELAEERIEAMEESDTSDVQKFLGIVTDESQRLSRLIGNVLAFAREKRGEVKIQPRPESIDAVIASSVKLFRPALERRGIQIELSTGAPDRVMVDPDALGQILANLVSNVEKYAASGKWLRITSQRRAFLTEVRLEDRGPGIPKGHRERIFQPFARLSSEMTDGVAGTGIGLGIARNLARLHGGDLTLEPGGGGTGCCFVVSLQTPLAEPTPNVADAAPKISL